MAKDQSAGTQKMNKNSNVTLKAGDNKDSQNNKPARMRDSGLRQDSSINKSISADKSHKGSIRNSSMSSISVDVEVFDP